MLLLEDNSQPGQKSHLMTNMMQKMKEKPAWRHSLSSRISNVNPLVQTMKMIWSRQSKRLTSRSLSWITQDGLDPPTLSPTLKRTQELLENYSQDPKFIKSLLLNNSRGPQFLDSEWLNLITTRAINLDCILVGQYTISHDERCTEKFSDLKFIFGSVKPVKTIDEHGKWVTAWDIAIQAMLFVFLHRASELTNYGIHIKSLFRVLPTYMHD